MIDYRPVDEIKRGDFLVRVYSGETGQHGLQETEFTMCFDSLDDKSQVDKLLQSLKKEIASAFKDSEIKVYGNLKELLSSPYMLELLNEHSQDYEDDELLTLLNSGNFDPDKDEHFELAKDFLELVEHC